jgi:tetratricopeptide (TPR) repeat protein
LPTAVDPALAKDLRKKALATLERGRYKDAIPLAEEAVNAEPDDATAYVYWGTALMELGKRTEAKAIFGRCVERAKKGPVYECKQFK